MATRYDKSSQMGDKAINFIRAICTDSGQAIFRDYPGKDIGIDAHVEFLKKTGEPTGSVAFIQSKGGLSYITKTGRYQIKADKKHFETWSRYKIPVIGIVYNPTLHDARWVSITEHLQSHPNCILKGPYVIDAPPEQPFSLDGFLKFQSYVTMHHQLENDSAQMRFLNSFIEFEKTLDMALHIMGTRMPKNKQFSDLRSKWDIFFLRVEHLPEQYNSIVKRAQATCNQIVNGQLAGLSRKELLDLSAHLIGITKDVHNHGFAIDILPALQEYYPQWLRPDIQSVQLIQKNRKIFLEIAVRESYKTRTDIEIDPLGSIFPPDQTDQENAVWFVEHFNPYLFNILTDLFTPEGCKEFTTQYGLQVLDYSLRGEPFGVKQKESHRLKEILRQLQDLLNWEADWNGYDAIPPSRQAVLRAEDWIVKIFLEVADLGHIWISPNVTASEDGVVVFEWWYGQKKLTVYISNQSTEYVQIWGTDMGAEKSEGKAEPASICRSLWLWLVN